MTTKRDEAERFFSHVNKDGPDGCWLWMAGIDQSGYGKFMSSKPWRKMKSHRWSWSHVNGPVLDGMLVCHRCDNPPCVNPEHLFLGTHQDNMRDMVAKGRSTAGERNPRALLTTDRVVSIREQYARGRTLKAIAADEGVHFATVSLVVRGTIWRHAGGPIKRNTTHKQKPRADHACASTDTLAS